MLFLVCIKARALRRHMWSKWYHTSTMARAQASVCWEIFVRSSFWALVSIAAVGAIFTRCTNYFVGVTLVFRWVFHACCFMYVCVCLGALSTYAISVSRMIDFNFSMRESIICALVPVKWWQMSALHTRIFTQRCVRAFKCQNQHFHGRQKSNPMNRHFGRFTAF